tara:strand:+ start:24 stop:584 length:561 start_codon:yes stop_codon:yes gene_type:complete
MYTQPFTCDSILITNFDYTPDSLNRISLFAANANMDLISYPGFVVLNHLGDTMAKETVNYFGIGFFPQQHFLEVYQPITNPFAGTIELHSWFYDSLRCVFPFTLDTTLSNMNDIINNISLYPNPTKDLVFINGKLNNVDFKIYDSFGRLIQTGCGNTFDLKNYKNGVYMVSLEIKEQFKTFLVYKQ